MLTKRTLSLALALTVGLAALGLAQEKGARGKDDETARLREKIKDLGSKVFEVREAAMEALREAKEKAVPLLEEAVESADAEIRWRAKALLRDIRRGDEEAEPQEDEGGFPFRRPFPGRGFRFFWGDRDLEDILKRDLDFDFDKLREEVEQSFEEMQKRFQQGDEERDPPGLRRGFKKHESGVRIEQGPDGRSRVEVLRGGKWVPLAGGEAREDSVYGVALKPAGDALRAQLSLPEGAGLLVTGIDEDGSAAQAGLERYDVILAVNGEEVSSPEAFREKVAATPAEKEAALQVVRKAKAMELTLPVERTRRF